LINRSIIKKLVDWQSKSIQVYLRTYIEVPQTCLPAGREVTEVHGEVIEVHRVKT
jgi:hypothetical protein